MRSQIKFLLSILVIISVAGGLVYLFISVPALRGASDNSP